jgi:hypothetical protein
VLLGELEEEIGVLLADAAGPSLVVLEEVVELSHEGSVTVIVPSF